MAQSPDDLDARVRAVADGEGRLPLSRMTGWEVFPFEPDGLRVVPWQAPQDEPPRHGEDAADCSLCRPERPAVWSDDRWRLATTDEPTGAPVVLLLQPHDHHDLGDLPEDLAADLGRLLVHVTRAVEGLPHVARAHAMRWGDGAAHLHVWFFARPQGFPQLRGSCFPVWDDLLPAVDVEQRDADARAVGEALAASYGGRVTA